MQGQIGDYCTVTSSNVAAIPAGTKIFYAQAAGATSLDSDVILYTGPGNTATGHCALDFATGLGAVHAVGRNQETPRHRARVMSRTRAGTTGPGTGRTGSGSQRPET